MRARLAVLGWATGLLAVGLLTAPGGGETVVAAVTAAGPALAAAQVETTHAMFAQPVDASGLLEIARRRLEEAERLDARKFMPASHRVAKAAIVRGQEIKRRLDEGGQPDSLRTRTAALAAAAREADRLTARLLGWLRFASETQRNPQPWETVAEAMDQALGEIARAGQVTLAPGATLPAAAKDIGQAFSARTARSRTVADSLAVVARRARQQLQAEDSVRDSTVVALRAEVSAVRRELWEAELRADMVEAECAASRQAAERQRSQSDALRDLEKLFGPGEGEVHFTPGGIVFRLVGLKFAPGSADLEAGQQAVLDKAIKGLQMFTGRPLRVDGHTDDSGKRDANLKLSQARAEKVGRLLIEKLKIPPEQVSIVGYGPDRPLAPNTTAEGKARNRRIEILVLPEA